LFVNFKLIVFWNALSQGAKEAKEKK